MAAITEASTTTAIARVPGELPGLHNDGRYLETELIVGDRGFEWGDTTGPAKVTNRA
jgi:hypothetical protein